MKKPNNNEAEFLIRMIHQLRIDRDLFRQGSIKKIAAAVGEKQPQVSYALCGTRSGPRYVEILNKIKSYLESIK